MNFRTLLQIFIFSLIALSSKAQLTGEWTDDNGACYKIRQVENQVFWYMDSRPRVINVFMGYLAGNTITGTWADVPGGNIQGSGTLALRVENQNRMVKIDQNGNYGGSVWTRGTCSNTAYNPPDSRPDLSGTWYDYSPALNIVGAISTIKQNGNSLVFTNKFNDSSEGSFLDNSTVIANKWVGGLKANLEDNNRRIAWSNGSVWERNLRTSARPDLSGTWYDYSPANGIAGAVSTIKQNGNSLVFTNTYNDSSEGSFLDNSTVIANKWAGGLKATLEDNNRRIAWSNGSVWERNLRTSARPDLSGTWYDYSPANGIAGAVSTIKQNGNSLVFTNTYNDSSEGYFLDNSTVIANAWAGGLKATLEDNGRKIVWTNGSVWQRTKR